MNRKLRYNTCQALLLAFLFIIEGVCLCQLTCNASQCHDENKAPAIEELHENNVVESHSAHHSSLCVKFVQQTAVVPRESAALQLFADLPPENNVFVPENCAYADDSPVPFQYYFFRNKIFLMIQSFRC